MSATSAVATRTFGASSTPAGPGGRFAGWPIRTRSPLAEILGPADILLGLGVTTKDEALHAVARFIGDRHNLLAPVIYARLVARERVASTALGHGVAVPHARVASVARPIAAFVRTRTAIPFNAPDKGGVTAMLVLIVPEHATDDHLVLLAETGALLSDEATRRRLCSCPDVEGVHAMLTASPGRHIFQRSNTMQDTTSPADPATAWFSPTHIVLNLDVRDSAEALEQVSAAIENVRGLAAAPVFRALWRREQAASTAVGKAFAIPHARITGITEPVTIYARTRKAIDFSAADGQPVSEMFVILIPAENPQADHLRLLALVAEAFSSKAFRRRLRARRDDADIRDAFSAWIAERRLRAARR